MSDIAKQAGVHTTTVSLALRNHPSLPLSTRTRLQTIANRLGYQPDPTLRALIDYRTRTWARKTTETLAYVTHWDTRWGWKNAPAHADFFSGASSKASQLGYQLEHFWLGEPNLSQKRLNDILCARGIVGLVIASHRRQVDLRLHFDWPRLSAVKIDFLPHEPALPIITNDQRAIIQLAVRRAIAAGYRRIGFVMDRSWDHSVDLAWSAGFLAEQQRQEPDERIPMLSFPTILPDEQRVTDNERWVPRVDFEKWLEQHSPEVIISKGSFVQTRLKELGISIPNDLAFVDLFLERLDGKTAGVRQNHTRVGELAVEVLTSQLQQHRYGLPEIPTCTLVEGTWSDGESMPDRSAALQPASSRLLVHGS